MKQFHSIIVKYTVAIALTFGVVLLSTNLKAISAVKGFETRCGWLHNPTPANVWLIDRQGEWTIGEQGGYQAKGDWPAFTPQQWVETNGSHGYGCACLKVKADRQTHKIIEIKSSYARSLSACRQDRFIKPYEKNLRVD
jgi:Protein of unknown function (DUF4087)